MQCLLILSQFKQLELYREAVVKVCVIMFFKSLSMGAELLHASGGRQAWRCKYLIVATLLSRLKSDRNVKTFIYYDIVRVSVMNMEKL